MSEILVLLARPYAFVDEESGESRAGVSVHYIDKSASNNDDRNGFGFSVFKESISDMSALSKVPAVYDAEFTTYVKQGTRCSKLANLTFSRECVLWK